MFTPFRRKPRALRRAIVLLLTALIAPGCSKTVNVPLKDVEKSAGHEGRYRIVTTSGSEYRTHGFAVSDSSVVITTLDEYDERYVRGREIDPIVLPLGDVKAIEKTEISGLAIDIAVLAGMAAVAYAMMAYFFAKNVGHLHPD